MTDAADTGCGSRMMSVPSSSEKPLCGFCKGQPVGNAATWLDGKPRPPAPCPRCGETNVPEPDEEEELMNDYAIPVEDAMQRLDVIPDYDPGDGPGPCVHTFAESGFGLLGAHWHLEDIEGFMRRWGVEEAGEMATAMGHGLVVPKSDRLGSLFIATRKESK